MIEINKRYLIPIITLLIIFILCILYIFKQSTKTVQTSAKTTKYKILVDVEESKLYLFEENILIKTYKCSGGKWSTPSPIGTWTVISKDTWGEGFGRPLDGT